MIAYLKVRDVLRALVLLVGLAIAVFSPLGAISLRPQSALSAFDLETPLRTVGVAFLSAVPALPGRSPAWQIERTCRRSAALLGAGAPVALGIVAIITVAVAALATGVAPGPLTRNTMAFLAITYACLPVLDRLAWMPGTFYAVIIGAIGSPGSWWAWPMCPDVPLGWVFAVIGLSVSVFWLGRRSRDGAGPVPELTS
jgi:hypothetical protein